MYWNPEAGGIPRRRPEPQGNRRGLAWIHQAQCQIYCNVKDSTACSNETVKVGAPDRGKGPSMCSLKTTPHILPCTGLEAKLPWKGQKPERDFVENNATNLANYMIVKEAFMWQPRPEPRCVPQTWACVHQPQCHRFCNIQASTRRCRESATAKGPTSATGPITTPSRKPVARKWGSCIIINISNETGTEECHIILSHIYSIFV